MARQSAVQNPPENSSNPYTSIYRSQVKPHVDSAVGTSIHSSGAFRCRLITGKIRVVISHRNRLRGPRAGSARSAGRWVGLGASALVTATGLVVAPTAHAGSRSADDCPDVEVIFARGTNEPPGLGKVGDAFVDSLRQQTGGLNIDTYGVNYAASKLQLHGGDGANDTINRVKQSVAKCPNTKIVLGGYSQGASVMDIVAGVPIGGISWGSSLPPQYWPTTSWRSPRSATWLTAPADRCPPRARCSGPRRSTCATPTTRSATRAPATSGRDTPRATSPCTPPRQRLSSRPSCWPAPASRCPGYGPPIQGYAPQARLWSPDAGYGPQTPGYPAQTPGRPGLAPMYTDPDPHPLPGWSRRFTDDVGEHRSGLGDNTSHAREPFGVLLSVLGVRRRRPRRSRRRW